MEIRKELKEVREALKSSLTSADLNLKYEDTSKALATLDRILGQDEAKMVERVTESIKEAQIQLMNNPPHPMCDMIVGSRYIAKAALRALGMMKERG